MQTRSHIVDRNGAWLVLQFKVMPEYALHHARHPSARNCMPCYTRKPQNHPVSFISGFRMPQPLRCVAERCSRSLAGQTRRGYYSIRTDGIKLVSRSDVNSGALSVHVRCDAPHANTASVLVNIQR